MDYILNIITADNNFDLFMMLVMTAAKATLLLAFGALLCLGMRRFSAAARHMLWASVIFAALLLPFLSFIKGWEISILPVPVSASNEVSDMPEMTALGEREANLVKEVEFQNNSAAVEKPLPILNTSELPAAAPKNTASLWANLINLVLVVWLAGVFLLILRLLTGLFSTNWLARRAGKFDAPALTEMFSVILGELGLKGDIRLLRSEHTLMPIVCGIRRPAVILPVAAESWTAERCRLVLLHELTHIARRDCLTQMLAHLACAFYWFNPFIWAAARRLRVEREQACDDYVLSIGTRPSDYAGHLLEIARSLQEKRGSVFSWSQPNTVAMAQHSQLEERLRAILNTESKHRAASRVIAFSLVLVTGILFLSLVIIHPTTASARNSKNSGLNASAQTEPARTKSLLDLFLKSEAKTPDKAGSKPAEKKDPTSTSSETADNQMIGQTGNELLSKPNNLQPGFQPTPVKSAPVTAEIDPAPESAPAPAPESNPAPNTAAIDPAPETFVKTDFEPARNNRGQQQETGDFIDEMASVGYKNLSVDELIRLKNIGVNADYVKALRAAGYDNLAVKDLISLRATGVTPKFIETVHSMGFKDVSLRDLSSLAVFRVTPEYIEKLKGVGYDELTLRNVIELKSQNVTPDFITTMNGIGFGKLPLKELVRLKIFNITPEFIRQARTRLGNDLTLKQIIDLKNSGILKDQ